MQASASLASQARVIAMTPRDRRIVALARKKLDGARVDFDEALRALREAVEESIPAGRTYLLGPGPIIGSIVSGVGIMSHEGDVVLVRVRGDGQTTVLGRFAP